MDDSPARRGNRATAVIRRSTPCGRRLLPVVDNRGCRPQPRKSRKLPHPHQPVTSRSRPAWRPSSCATRTTTPHQHHEHLAAASEDTPTHERSPWSSSEGGTLTCGRVPPPEAWRTSGGLMRRGAIPLNQDHPGFRASRHTSALDRNCFHRFTRTARERLPPVDSPRGRHPACAASHAAPPRQRTCGTPPGPAGWGVAVRIRCARRRSCPGRRWCRAPSSRRS